MDVRSCSCIRIDWDDGTFFHVDHINKQHLSEDSIASLNYLLAEIQNELEEKYKEAAKLGSGPTLGVNVQDSVGMKDVPHG